ncbi:MAG: Asp23/Gls24 family envelope stress response protein [Bacillota bacterium]
MALRTSNIYGDITISDEAVAIIANRVASECYGVAEMVSRRLSDSILSIFNKESATKGVKLVTVDNRIFIDLYVLLMADINQEAVVESLKSTVKYHVEQFTGMRVKAVNVHVLGVKL